MTQFDKNFAKQTLCLRHKDPKPSRCAMFQLGQTMFLMICLFSFARSVLPLGGLTRIEGMKKTSLHVSRETVRFLPLVKHEEK